MSPGIAAIVPPHGSHRLFWNNYPATALDHDLSNAVETALLFISINGFLSDPKGLTCITLHFFTDFNEVFTSDTMTGRRKPTVRDSGIQSMRASRLEPVLGKNHHPPLLKRQVTCQSIRTTGASRSWTGDQCFKVKKAGRYRKARVPDDRFTGPWFR